MQYRRLGTTGMKVSRLCLGTMTYGSPKWRQWVLDEQASRPFIKQSLNSGINFFDTANMYSIGESERVVGKALLDYAPREDVVIATKVFNPTGDAPNNRGLSRKHIMDAIDSSLRRLGTDHVDLYQIHRWDYHTPIEETMEALHDVVKAGKVRYIGASSMFAWQFAKAQFTAEKHGWTRFVTMQPMYNLIYREEEREMIPQCADQGIGVIPWSPLARGILAGKTVQGEAGETARARTDENTRKWRLGSDIDQPVIAALKEVADNRGTSMARIALAWVLSNPVVTAPIIGASKPGHIEEALAALELELSENEKATLEAHYVPHQVAGHA
ncbi:Aldo/keto reductase family protein [Marinobacter sp. DSM 26671]|jgi:aryl-alcohol dehydrogenase-like predicted oxidoreductase|uniref:aldo/keto reductase n=1 Tax=unclassified Marinobacter TaxID=83889 RepID=UPI00069EC50B|nr:MULTISPECIES: aldo/keto reductase [unclassified Marinobacter]AKV98157.1 aldo/keto reductase [Marinobacter sp. CP1]SFE42508.1 Aldo/keto reductase family protein [Marinobacter sp. DSM 26671]